MHLELHDIVNHCIILLLRYLQNPLEKDSVLFTSASYCTLFRQIPYKTNIRHLVLFKDTSHSFRQRHTPVTRAGIFLRYPIPTLPYSRRKIKFGDSGGRPRFFIVVYPCRNMKTIVIRFHIDTYRTRIQSRRSACHRPDSLLKPWILP